MSIYKRKDVRKAARMGAGSEFTRQALAAPTIAGWLLFARRVSSARSVPASA